MTDELTLTIEGGDGVELAIEGGDISLKLEDKEPVLQSLKEQFTPSVNAKIVGTADGTDFRVVPGQAEYVEVPFLNSSDDLGLWVNTEIAKIQTANDERLGITFDFPLAQYYTDTTITLPKETVGTEGQPGHKPGVGSHITFQSSHPLGTKIEKRGDSGRVSNVAFDLQGADEVHLRRLQIYEQDGFRNCCMVILGGTTCQLTDCWLNGAKWGLIAVGVGGGIITDCKIENCDELVLCGSRYWNPDLGIERDTNNVAHISFVENIFQNNRLRFINFLQVELNVTSGTVAVDDTITAGGVSAKVWMVEGDWILVPWQDGTGLTPSAPFTTLEGAVGTVVSRAGNFTKNIRFNGVNFSGTVADPADRNKAVLYVDGVTTFKWVNVNVYDHGWIEFKRSDDVQIMASTCKADAAVAKGLTVDSCTGGAFLHTDKYATAITNTTPTTFIESGILESQSDLP